VTTSCWSSGATEEENKEPAKQDVGCSMRRGGPGCDDESKQQVPKENTGLRRNSKGSEDAVGKSNEESAPSSSDNQHYCCCLCKGTGKEHCTAVSSCNNCQSTCDNKVFPNCGKVFAGCQ
jgi:hypothetical protein